MDSWRCFNQVKFLICNHERPVKDDNDKRHLPDTLNLMTPLLYWYLLLTCAPASYSILRLDTKDGEVEKGWARESAREGFLTKWKEKNEIEEGRTRECILSHVHKYRSTFPLGFEFHHLRNRCCLRPTHFRNYKKISRSIHRLFSTGFLTVCPSAMGIARNFHTCHANSWNKHNILAST